MEKLHGFIDDSKDEKHFVLAGYFSTPSRWRIFEKEWESLLQYKPKWPYFKMNEIAQMLDDAAWEKLMWMQQCIERNVLFGVTCAIDIEAYKDACNDIGWNGPANGHHHLANSYILDTLLDFLEERIEASGIEITFDTQTDVSGLVGEAYNLYAESRRQAGAKFIAQQPEFKDDNSCFPLQAADFAAWWARKAFLESGDAATPPVFGPARGDRKWTEGELETYIFQPTKKQIMAKLTRKIARFEENDWKSYLPEHVRKKYKK